MSPWDENETKRLVQELPFYNRFIEKLKILGLKNIDLLHKLPFSDELNILKILEALKRYARSYKVEIVDSKDLLSQLEASKSNIKICLKTF